MLTLLLLVDLLVGAWLVAVTHGGAGCSGLLCDVATFGGHPRLTLVAAAAAASALAVSACVTRCFSRATHAQLRLGAAGAVLTAASAGGAVVVLVFVVVAVAVGLVLLALVFGVLTER
jgi:hypothetical protein